ncbi:hypothetical protein ASG04_03390 [Curtobacterium sp. Leaf183]|nr:hypothetical protein ASG04_03390 [Curtobacterium sp. Leaf183]
MRCRDPELHAVGPERTGPLAVLHEVPGLVVDLDVTTPAVVPELGSIEEQALVVPQRLAERDEGRGDTAHGEAGVSVTRGRLRDDRVDDRLLDGEPGVGVTRCRLRDDRRGRTAGVVVAVDAHVQDGRL